MPEFGDPEADQAAKAALQELFPDREIVQLNIDGVAAASTAPPNRSQRRAAAFICLSLAPEASNQRNDSGATHCPGESWSPSDPLGSASHWRLNRYK